MSLSVGSAQIDDLAVSTLKIQGEAVTVPRGASASGQFILASYTVHNVLTLPSINTQGGSVYVSFSAIGYDGTNYAGEGEDPVSNPIIIRLLRDGLTLREFSGFQSAMLVDSPGFGDHVYTLQMAGSAGNGGPRQAYVTERTLVAIGCKR